MRAAEVRVSVSTVLYCQVLLVLRNYCAYDTRLLIGPVPSSEENCIAVVEMEGPIGGPAARSTFILPVSLCPSRERVKPAIY